jgi:hypothetical protein
MVTVGVTAQVGGTLVAGVIAGGGVILVISVFDDMVTAWLV